MAERRITLGCRLAGEKRVPLPDDADKAVAEQRLHAHFRPRVAEHADVEVHQPLPQRPRVLVGLGGEAQAHARSCAMAATISRAAKVSVKPSLARIAKVRSRAARSSPATAGRSAVRAS